MQIFSEKPPFDPVDLNRCESEEFHRPNCEAYEQCADQAREGTSFQTKYTNFF